MKLVTAGQMRKLDSDTINRVGVPGIVLMENAANGVFDVVSAHESPLAGKRAAVICGSGNNGGDGFAVARHLHNAGASPVVFLSSEPSRLAGDAKTNYNICKRLKIQIETIPSERGIQKLRSALKKSDFIIDALLGTGITGELKPIFLKIINEINAAGKTVYSVDIPSGVIADDGRVLNGAVKADHTITFGAPKIGLFTHPGAARAGKVYIADIGIPTEMLDRLTATTHLTSPGYITKHIRPRGAAAHKGDCGKVLVIGGSRGMSGAPALAGMSALRSGAGLVYIAAPSCVADTIDRVFVEGVTLPQPDENGAFSSSCVPALLKQIAAVDAVVIGPGMSVSESTCKIVLSVLAGSRVPILIDADGLNCLARMDYPKMLKNAKAPVVLTPHPGEMASLIRCATRELQADRLNLARRFAKKCGVVLILKGAGTIIASPAGEAYINPTGNEGMATAGSGDVLSGVGGALLAEGIDAFPAAVCAAFIHGRAGDLTAEITGKRSATAGDFSRALVKTIKSFEEKI